jgi:hypothetical protein
MEKNFSSIPLHHEISWQLSQLQHYGIRHCQTVYLINRITKYHQYTSPTLTILEITVAFCIDGPQFFPQEELRRLVKIPSMLLHYYMKFLEVIFGIILLVSFYSTTVWRHRGSKSSIYWFCVGSLVYKSVCTKKLNSGNAIYHRPEFLFPRLLPKNVKIKQR